MTEPWRGRPTVDRFVDAAAVAAAILGALLVAGEAEATGRIVGGELFWGLVLAIGASFALWSRRRHPVGVALLLLPVAAVAEPVGVAVLIAVYTVAGYRPVRVAAAVATAHVLAVVPYSFLRPDPDLKPLASIVATVVLLSLAVGLGTVGRGRRELLASLRERTARAESEAHERAERLRAQERERIAREMHDALAHRISLVSLHAGALEVRPDLSPDAVADVAATIRGTAHQALTDLRGILAVLRTGPEGTDVGPPPSLADLDELLAEARTAGTPLTVHNRLTAVTSPPESVSRTAYRVVQEGLTNARKHAPGSGVELRLDGSPGEQLRVSVRNRMGGATAPAVPGARAGLLGLAERVRLAGGRLDHGPRREPDGRVEFRLEAWLPWPT